MIARHFTRARVQNVALPMGVLVLTALLAEPLLRMRYVEPVPGTPPAVLEVQPWLKLDADLGYTWRTNVSADQGILFHNADIEYEPLATDGFGIINAPEAIADLRAGRPVHVLALGDSFMEMAAHDFHRAFAAESVFYYSLAIHRHAPPHYARMFESRGIALKPRQLLVGLFENDFAESADFDNWRRSGLDWFAYHSGTWCGRTVPISARARFIREYFPGYEGLARVLHVRLRGERMSVAGPSADQVRRVTEELRRIVSLAHENGIEMWLLLIPSKPTARGEITAESRAYDLVVRAIEPLGVGILDLREPFQAYPDPASLYYQEDGHWNGNGVELASRIIMDRLKDLN